MLFKSKGGSRTAATSKMERFVIIVNGWKQSAHLGRCSSPRSASEENFSMNKVILVESINL